MIKIVCTDGDEYIYYSDYCYWDIELSGIKIIVPDKEMIYFPFTNVIYFNIKNNIERVEDSNVDK